MSWPCLNILDKTKLLMLHAKTSAKNGFVLLWEMISSEIFIYRSTFLKIFLISTALF